MATAKSNQQEKDQSADVLKWILGQTYRAKARKNLLDRRLKMINLESPPLAAEDMIHCHTHQGQVQTVRPASR